MLQVPRVYSGHKSLPSVFVHQTHGIISNTFSWTTHWKKYFCLEMYIDIAYAFVNKSPFIYIEANEKEAFFNYSVTSSQCGRLHTEKICHLVKYTTNLHSKIHNHTENLPGGSSTSTRPCGGRCALSTISMSLLGFYPLSGKKNNEITIFISNVPCLS